MLALSRAQVPQLAFLRRLIEEAGSAKELLENASHIQDIVPDATPKLVSLLTDRSLVELAEREMEFIEKNNIKLICMGDKAYPCRLAECDDAPLVLHSMGNAALTARHIVSIVGTRHASEYGKELCANFVADLAKFVPGTLIVSGLAYGIDIHAHRAALQQDFPTVGVLAHGLDRIYPSAHRKTAIEMMNHGGLLTEFMSGTNPDRQNFVKRNRIVAGMSDATIVVDSAAKGGALISAELAESYHRDCFAFPGRTTDIYSAGCNELIKNNRASLILSAEDFVNAMGWNSTHRKPKEAVQRELFLDLSEEEKNIVNLLQESPEGIQINTLVVKANIPINRMSPLLFELEMKGVVKALAGGIYQLI